MVRLTLLLAVVAMSGCSNLTGNATETSAFIDDGLTSDGLKIAMVDGEPPLRWAHPKATTVPFVLVEPGRHTFTLEGSDKTFTADVERGRTYRTAEEDGQPTLVKNHHGHQPEHADEVPVEQPAERSSLFPAEKSLFRRAVQAL